MAKQALIRPLAYRYMRGPARLEGTDVVVDYSRGSAYDPLTEPDVGLELTRVRAPSDAQIFATRFGLLRTGVEGIDVIPQVPGRAPAQEFIDAGEILRTLVGVIADVRKANDGNTDSVARLRARFVQTRFADGRRPRVRYWHLTEDKMEDADDRTLLIHASGWVGAQLSVGLRDSRAFIFDRAERGEAVAPGTLRVGILPRALIDVCYLTIALKAAEKEPVEVCPECKRVFVVEDARQKFCDPKCAGRARYRKFDQKRRDREHAPKTRPRRR